MLIHQKQITGSGTKFLAKTSDTKFNNCYIPRKSFKRIGKIQDIPNSVRKLFSNIFECEKSAVEIYLSLYSYER